MRASLSALSTDALVLRLTEVLKLEDSCVIDSVFFLAELRERRTHLEMGHDSLFTFCVKHLGLEHSRAYRRSAAADLICRFPLAAELLRAGTLSVSALLALKPVLTEGNHTELLGRTIGMTEEQARSLASELRPLPVVPDSIRLVHTLRPATSPSAVRAPQFSFSPKLDSGPEPLGAPSNGPVLPLGFSPKPDSEPMPPALVLTETRRVTATLSRDSYDQLLSVTAALSHRIPDGNLAEVLDACFRITLDVLQRQKLGAPTKPGTAPVRAHIESSASSASASPASSPSESSASASLASESYPLPSSETTQRSQATNRSVRSRMGGSASFFQFMTALADASRYIPVSVRRAVWARDGGCCSFVGSTGHRCESRYQLEFDHAEAFACGGESTIENVRLRCRRHNIFEAERVFGREFMAKFKTTERKLVEHGNAYSHAAATVVVSGECGPIELSDVRSQAAGETDDNARSCETSAVALGDERTVGSGDA